MPLYYKVLVACLISYFIFLQKKSLKDPRTKFDYKSHLLASKAKSEVNLKSDEDDDSEEDSPGMYHYLFICIY